MENELTIERGIPPPVILPPVKLRDALGLCYCGKEPRRKGLRLGENCARAFRASARKMYQGQRAKGLCGYGTCKTLAQAGKSMCREHLQVNDRKIRALLDGRVAQGLCRRCGNREIVGTKTWCLLCYQHIGGKDGGTPRFPLPGPTRKLIRQFWRLDRIDQRRAFAESIIRLLPDERMREMVGLRQGLVDGVDHTLEEIGNQYKVTRERIRQILAKAFKILNGKGVDVSSLVAPTDLQRSPTSHRPRRKLTPRENRKERARHAVAEARRKGQIVKQPCERCGHSEKVLAHHSDYGKPLTVQWLCHRHHAEAHGKQLHDPKPEYDAPAWLVKLGTPSSDLYDAPSIVADLKRLWIKQGQIQDVTGLSRRTIMKIVCGERVRDNALALMLRYIHAMKQDQAA